VNGSERRPPARRERSLRRAGPGRRPALLWVTLLLAPLAFAAAPSIDSVTAMRSPNDKETELVVSGDDLGSSTALWTSFGVSDSARDRNDKRVAFRFPSSASVGVFAARVFGSNGVSDLHLFMLDDLPLVGESTTNKGRASAQVVEIGSAINGTCDELAFDWFKFRASKGQRVSIEVIASRLGWRLDSVLRVIDASGRQIAHNDDVPGLRGDSFVSFAAANAGDYFVELRDVNYGGASDFFYRLRIGDFPLATTAFPLAVEQGSTQTFQLAGPGGEAGRVQVVVTNSGSIPLASKGRRGSTFAQALARTGRETMEREPNDNAANATKVSLDDGINGRFDKISDRDCYEFTARQGERTEFRAATRSLGSACDVVLELQSADGAQLARSNPSAADEGVVTHRFSSNGTYRLVVDEALGASGPNCVYRITTQHPAGFTLTIDNDRVNVAPGKTFDLKVTCNRGDYKGSVTLMLDGVASLALTNNVVAEGKTNATIKVTVPETLVPAAPRFFTVVGMAQRDGAEVRARASTASALRRRFPQMLYPPAELDGVIALGVTAAK